MKNWKLYIITILMIALLGFLYGFAQHKSNEEKITKISVNFPEKHPDFISAETVNKLLIQSDAGLLNKPKSLINLHQIEERVRMDQMIEQAQLYMTLDGVLQADVIERVPVARVQKGEIAYYIDRQGARMPLSFNYAARVPLVTGAIDEKKEKEVFQLILKINKDPLYKKQIIGYHIKENGDYLLSTRIGRHKILLGKMDHLDDKLKKLKIFYKKKWNSEQMKIYKLINLKYKHQVVCSK